MGERGWCCAIVMAAVGAATAAGAHPLAPSLLTVREHDQGRVEVVWKTPLLRLPGVDLRPVLPPECPPTSPPTAVGEADGDSAVTRWTVDCGSAGLVGKVIGLEGLGAAKTDALLRIELADGRAVDTILRAREPFFTVREREEPRDVARHYVELGFEHILGGYDHLLFVFGLLLLITNRRLLIATITAFTIGHSLTLSLAMLGVARVPAPPIEALIAGSIFVLAVELARVPGGATTLIRRRPWVMAVLFGFLHGLGFAGALRAVGLPADAVPLALLSFNVGIEIGQLVFVVGILALVAAARPVTRRIPAWAHALPVYAMGSLAACWTIERMLPLLR